MPRNLADLSVDERKALLNHVWERMVASEIAAPTGANSPIDSPIGKTGTLPHDLAPHLAESLASPAGAMMDWKILNASCAAPDLAGLTQHGRPVVR